MTVNIGAYVVAARWVERQLNKSYTLQTVSGEALPILK
jgi:hypothetical protein